MTFYLCAASGRKCDCLPHVQRNANQKRLGEHDAYTVEIDTLDELIAFMDEAGQDIIISREESYRPESRTDIKVIRRNEDQGYEYPVYRSGRIGITIYDDYVE